MTKAKNNGIDPLLSALQATDSVLLFAHIAPDGDTLGSTLALRLLLLKLGKKVQAYLDGDVPENLTFLPGCDQLMHPEGAGAPKDALAVSVDVSCEERLGACAALYHSAAVTAVIDHHGTNEGFGEINWIDGGAPATAILVFRLYRALECALSAEEALCLYTALATDTGNFVYQSVNAEAFTMMAALMEAGLPLARYSRVLFRQKEEGFVRLLGQALPSLRLCGGGSVAGLQATLEQFKALGLNPAETDGVVDYAIDLKGVKMAYFLHENEAGEVKVSLRALAPYRVDQIAASFGGGGHQLASGGTLHIPLAEAVQKIESALCDAFAAQSEGL